MKSINTFPINIFQHDKLEYLENHPELVPEMSTTNWDIQQYLTDKRPFFVLRDLENKTLTFGDKDYSYEFLEKNIYEIVYDGLTLYIEYKNKTMINYFVIFDDDYSLRFLFETYQAITPYKWTYKTIQCLCSNCTSQQ